MRFLGMAGYYRKLCNNFSFMSALLTVWNENCQNFFDNIKAMLSNSPVLLASNFCKPFKIAVDASGVGEGGVPFQEEENGVIILLSSYFSHKFNKDQKVYSTIEKECLALILSLQLSEVNVSPLLSP